MKPSLALRSIVVWSFAAMAFSAAMVRGADPFAENIRNTEPLTPEEQQKTFKLPPGFQIQLVASEPDLAKPINMAFDAKGRLWVTESREYPLPVPLDKPAHDSVRIFSDFGTNGRAHKMTIFAEGLNIPTGVLPYKNGVIVWSIPNIWYMEDTDGDGKADKRTILYGPLGWERDAHGMNSSFRRGYDGWMYATHGFNNNTTLRGRDGSVVQMNSGNTYRVQVDGSRAEQFTWGQVNPFGLTFDSLGNLYSSDCHSEPAYQLLRGGYYPSFGKPHDGLGFAPQMIFHDHGSTAIDGMSMYSDDQWPEEFRENIFSGNVMTCRINRDRLENHGTTRIALETPDFVESTDPWFRPVDTQIGPDGAMYIADFYNRIIGHYEVPLTHPGRDRFRGRIWRVVYTGDKAMGLKRKRDNDLSKFNAPKLIAALSDPSLTYRMLAMNELVDRVGQPARKSLVTVLADKKSAPSQRIHGMWALQRLGGLDEKTWLRLADDPDFGVRTHAMRVAAELPQISVPIHQKLLTAMTDANPWVQRGAAEALGMHPEFANVKPLLALIERASAEDTHMIFAGRKALRDQLKPDGVLAKITSQPDLAEPDSRVLAGVAVAVPTAEAAAFLISHVQRFTETREKISDYLRHATRYAPESAVATLAAFVRRQFATEPDLQLALFKSVQQGFEQRGSKLTDDLRAWGEELAKTLLGASEPPDQFWSNTPHQNATALTNPWLLQHRRSADGNADSLFLSSLPTGGESLTGILRSPEFVIPPRMSFFMAGHDGPPGRPPQGKNLIRLRASDTGAVIEQTTPPRNDTAQRFTWELSPAAGRPGYLEVVDGDTGTAYAWLAVGRFNPPIVKLPALDPSRHGQRQEAAAELAQSLGLARLTPQLTALLLEPRNELGTRAAAARAMVSFMPDPLRSALAGLIAEPGLAGELRERIAVSLPRGSSGQTNLLVESLRVLPRRGQLKLAQSLAASAAGATTLLDMIGQGQAPAQLLLERSVTDKLTAVLPPDQSGRIAQLSKGLPPANQEIQKLIDARRAKFGSASPSLVKGAELFTRNCRVCHQLEGNGALVGPQLDGIGNRGLERVLEDILDPNRAVDLAFRTTVFTLKDGDVASGLFRREEGERIIIADSTGKELPIAKNQIVERRESQTSLMPGNFGDIIPENDFYDLVAFLLSKRGATQ